MKFSRSWVTHQVSSILQRKEVEIPVNLARVAVAQRVRAVELRDMFPDGAMSAVAGGFEIFIKSHETQRCELPGDGADLILTKRQRFSLAHEIAHTLFFDSSYEIPKLLADTPSGEQLEALCNFGAAELLMPQPVLRRRINSESPLSGERVVQLSDSFGVSIEAFLCRVDRIQEAKRPHFALLFARKEGQHDAVIRTMIYDPSLRQYMRRPSTGESVSEWVGGLDDEFWSANRCERSKTRNGWIMILRKVTPATGREDFLLEVAFEPVRYK